MSVSDAHASGVIDWGKTYCALSKRAGITPTIDAHRFVHGAPFPWLEAFDLPATGAGLRVCFRMVCLLTVCCLIGLSAGGKVSAQEELPGMQREGNRPLRENLVLATEVEAAKRLGVIDEYLRDQKWAEALDALQPLLESAGNRLVQVNGDALPGLQRYQHLEAACQARLSALPAEALEVYRQRFDPVAERWYAEWERTGFAEPLRRISRLAPFSSRGTAARFDLGELAWDRGDLQTARAEWSRLLGELDAQAGVASQSPTGMVTPAEVAARVTLCDVLTGSPAQARRAVQAWTAKYGGEQSEAPNSTELWPLRWMQLLAEQEQTAQLGLIEPFVAVGGDFTRAKPAPALADIGAVAWQVRLPGLKATERAPLWDRAGLMKPVHRGGPSAFPVCDEERVYLNTGTAILAWNLIGGRGAWGSAGTIYPPGPQIEPIVASRPLSGHPQPTLALHQGRLYARLGSPVSALARSELRDLESELVCLDVAEGEGRLVWRLGAYQLEHPGPADAGQGWNFEGAPVVVDGRAYVIAARRRPQLEFLAVCLHALTGEVLWTQFIGAARQSVDDEVNRVTQLLLTVGGERLFLSTDVGSIMALSSHTGEIEWAASYESAAPRGLSASTVCPPIYWQGRLFVAPADHRALFCFEAATGIPHWRRALPKGVNSLVGVVPTETGSTVIAAGEALWAVDVETGNWAWRLTPDAPEDYGYGRPVLAGGRVYWTSQEQLSVVDAATGAVTRQIPLRTPLSPTGGGNLLVAGQQLLIASGSHLTALSAYGRWREETEEILSGAPRRADALRPLNVPHTHEPLEPQFPVSKGRQLAAQLQVARLMATTAGTSADSISHLLQGAAQLARTPAQRRTVVQTTQELLSPANSTPALLGLSDFPTPQRTPEIVPTEAAIVPDPPSSIWNLAWQISTEPAESLSRPAAPGQASGSLVRAGTQGEAGAIVFFGPSSLRGVNPATGQTRWQRTLDRPVVWSDQRTNTLALVDRRWLQVLSTDDGQTRWLTPAVQSMTPPLSTWCTTNSLLLEIDLTRGLVARDRQTGRILWQSHRPLKCVHPGLTPSGAIVVQARAPERLFAYEAFTGAEQDLGYPVVAAWQCGPMSVADPNTGEAAVVGLLETGHLTRLSGLSGPAGNLLKWRTTTDPLPAEQQRPVLIGHPTAALLLTNGQTLSRVDREPAEFRRSDLALWSRRISYFPIENPVEQIAVGQSHCFSVGTSRTGQIWLSAWSLETGEPVWQRSLPEVHGGWQLCCGVGFVAAAPCEVASGESWSVIVCREEQGRVLIQQGATPSASGRIELAAFGDGLLIAAPGECRLLAPIDRTYHHAAGTRALPSAR